MMTNMTRMTTTSSEGPKADSIISFRCPACSQATRLHLESTRFGMEVLCTECSAILRIEKTNPLTLTEVEEEDLL